MTALVIAAWKFSSGTENTPKATPSARSTQPAVTGDANLLITAVRGNCWLEVQSIRVLPNGKRQARALYEGTLEKGQSQRFVAKQLWVSAHSPGNLAIRLNGEPESIGKGQPVVVLISANSITSALANEFAEASEGLHQASLIYLGLVLFFITFVVLSLSKVLLAQLKKGEGSRS